MRIIFQLLSCVGLVLMVALVACGQSNADKEQAKPKTQYKITCIFNGKVEIHTSSKIWVDDDGTWVQSGIRYSPGVPCKREIIPVSATVESAPTTTLSPVTPE